MGLFGSVGKAVGGAVGGIGKQVGSLAGGVLGGTVGGISEGLGFGNSGFSPVDFQEMARIREESMARLTAKAREEREKDLAQGRARGQELFGKTFYEQSRPERSGDISSVLERRKAQLQGFQAPEVSALRAEKAQQAAIQNKAAQKNLAAAQAKQGVRGGLAAAQQRQQLREQEGARAAAERDLFLANIAQQQNALNSYEQSIRGAEGEEINRFGKRQLGQLGTELGYAQLGAAERAGIQAQLLGEAQAKAATQNASGGGKK